MKAFFLCLFAAAVSVAALVGDSVHECREGDCCDIVNGRFRPETYICRLGSDCFADVNCTGDRPTCPNTVPKFKPKGTVCANASGPCEYDGLCSGESGECLGKGMKPRGIVCNESSGPCEDNAVCNGVTKKRR